MTEMCQDPSCEKERGHEGSVQHCDIPLTIKHVVERLPMYIDPSDWRSRVSKGTAPPADYNDTDRPRARSQPLWNGSTIDTFAAVKAHPRRRGSPYLVFQLSCGDLNQRWAVIKRRNGEIVGRYPTVAEATKQAVVLNRNAS